MKENNLTNNQKELAETKRMLQTLISNLNGMVYRCRSDRNRTMEYISGGCFGITGYHPNELVENDKLSYRDVIHEDDRERIWLEIQKSINNDKPFTLSYQIVTADKKVKWVKEQGVGIRNPEDDSIIIEGFIADATSEKRN